jgi:DHA3 family macrolide efflux protein-like MFS transporter
VTSAKRGADGTRAANRPSRRRRDVVSLLADRRFAALFAAHLVSNLGDWLAFLALFGLAVLDWQVGAAHVSALAVAYVLPLALVAPLAGVLVDRWSLRRVMVGSDLLRAGIVLAMAYVPSFAGLCVLLFAHQTISCFFNPAQQSSLPRLVPQARLLGANALTTSAANLSKLIGPAVAGVLVAALGPRGCFFADAASFVASAAALATLPPLRPLPKERAGPESGRPARSWNAMWGELGEGFAFLRHTAAVRRILVQVAWAMVPFGAFIALVAVYARDQLGAGSRTMGLLLSAIGVGAVGGALAVAHAGLRASRERMTTIGMLLGALALMALAGSHALLPAAAGVLVLGAAAAVVLVPAQSFVQETTPPALLGRLTSVAVAAVGLVEGVGMAVAGISARVVGVPRLLVSGAVWLACGVIVALARRR